MPLAPKTQIDRYEIRSLLGPGGMGEVYLAQDTSLNRRVALKVLPPEVASNHDRMRRFKQEASAAASLNHPIRRLQNFDPNFPTTLFFLGRAYEAKGMYDQAVAYYDMSGQRSGLPSEILAEATQVYKRSGWKAYLEKSLEEMLAQPADRRFPPFVVASYYARLGRKDEAFAWLQRGYEERDFRMRHVNVSFEFDSLRSDPRFVDFLRRLELPE